MVSLPFGTRRIDLYDQKQMGRLVRWSGQWTDESIRLEPVARSYDTPIQILMLVFPSIHPSIHVIESRQAPTWMYGKGDDK